MKWVSCLFCLSLRMVIWGCCVQVGIALESAPSSPQQEEDMDSTGHTTISNIEKASNTSCVDREKEKGSNALVSTLKVGSATCSALPALKQPVLLNHRMFYCACQEAKEGIKEGLKEAFSGLRLGRGGNKTDGSINDDSSERSGGAADGSQRSGVPKHRMDRFTKLLEASVVDMDVLRDIAWNGVPPTLRPVCWKLLLGYLPPAK